MNKKNKIILRNRKEWLEAREHVVTATEVSALFGLNPYMSARKMLENKLQPEFMENAYVFVGRLLESVVVEATNLLLDRNFKLFDKGEEKVFYKHPEIRMGVTPDAHEDMKVLLECKTTNPRKFLEWDEDYVPNNYVIQVFAQIMCTGIREAYIACMSTDLSPEGPNSDFPLIVYKVTLLDETEELIKQEVNRFWECVYTGKTFSFARKVNKRMKELITESIERVY